MQTTLDAPLPAWRRTDAWINEALLLATAAILPLYMSMLRLPLGGLVLREGDLVALFSIVASLVFLPVYTQRLFSKPAIAIYGLCLFIVVQGVFLHLIKPGIKEALQYLFIFLTLVATGVQIERAPRRFLKALLILMAVSMAYTLAYHFSIGEYVRYKKANDGRYIFGLLSVLLLLYARECGWRRWPVAFFVLSLVPLVASLERKGPLGVLVIGTLMLASQLLAVLRVRASVALALCLPLLIAGLVLAFGPLEHFWAETVRNNFFLDEAEALYTSNMHRTALLLNGLDILEKHWLWGIGSDQLAVEMRKYFTDVRLGNGTHNFYLDTLIKYGIFGGAMLFGAMALGIRAALRARPAPGYVFYTGYLLFVITFISDGLAVIYLAMLSMVCGPLFGPGPGQPANPAPAQPPGLKPYRNSGWN